MTLPHHRYYCDATAVSTPLSSDNDQQPSTDTSSFSSVESEGQSGHRYEELASEMLLGPCTTAREDLDSAAQHLAKDEVWKSMAGLFSYGGDELDIDLCIGISERDKPWEACLAEFTAEAWSVLEKTGEPKLRQRYASALRQVSEAAMEQAQQHHLPATADGIAATKKRTNLSKSAKRVLRAWFEAHFHHPYPTDDEKDTLCAEAGIGMEQVNNWFINTRVREWKPKLHKILADNAAGDSATLNAMMDKVIEPYQAPMTEFKML
jgi:hypothetical protein